MFAGCGGGGDDSDKAPGKDTAKCGDVAEANSGRGASGIEFKGIASCADAQELLRNPTGLVTYDCKSVEKTSEGERFRCTDGSKVLVFTTGTS